MEALIANCKECIENQYIRTASFQRWLKHGAELDMNEQYQETFEEVLPAAMESQETETILWILSRNLVFSIRAFLEYNNDASCGELLYFVERFLENQLGDKQIWEFVKN
jgi:hypothetical protein